MVAVSIEWAMISEMLTYTSLRITALHESGAVDYEVDSTTSGDWSLEYYEEPSFDHVGPTRRGRYTADGLDGPLTVEYIIASAPTIAALAHIVRTYLLRNKNRKVTIYWQNGKRRLEVTGDLPADDIEKLMDRQLRSSDEPEEGAGSSGNSSE